MSAEEDRSQEGPAETGPQCKDAEEAAKVADVDEEL
jgi:hypothetical protein